jgi:glycosyltransferase involved in cell wall biosynthesis
VDTVDRSGPALSIVVVTYNMRREAPRTLRSLSHACQHGVRADDYEVIVVDNGSVDPLRADQLASLGPNFRLYSMIDPGPSPAAAANAGVALARADSIGVILDGARMVTPGVVANALRGLSLHRRAVVSTLAWHLGPDHQSRSILQGYDQRTEDALLEGIGWPDDGYRLFEISALAASNPTGWFGPVHESCCFFMRRALYDELGGYDERFDLPGGGFVNLDIFARVLALPDTELVVLLGEGSFHQVHGGVASNATAGVPTEFAEQYVRLRGTSYMPPDKAPIYLGSARPPVLAVIEESARRAREAGR